MIISIKTHSIAARLLPISNLQSLILCRFEIGNKEYVLIIHEQGVIMIDGKLEHIARAKKVT